MSSVSNSNKTDTNKESLSYLVLYSYDTDTVNLDNDSYIICDSQDIKEIITQVREDWNSDINIEKLIILPFYKSQLKRIKQTLELV